MPPRHARLGTALWALALVGAALIPLLFPGDTPFINDEPLFLRKALEPGLATSGLRGTVGVTYGPTPIWIYGLLLRVTHDPLALVQLRAALFMAVTAFGLAWLATATRRPLSLALLPLLSPYLWIYARLLWDTWLIPLSTLGLAAYAAFHARPAPGRLWIATLALVAGLLSHPMSAPLVIAVAAHGLYFHRRWMRDHRPAIAALLAAALLLAGPWIFALAQELTGAAPPPPWTPPPLLEPTPDPPAPRWMPFVFPLLGGRLLSAQGIDYFYGDPWFARARWVLPFALATWAAHLLVWSGILIAIRRLREAFAGRRPWDPGLHVSAVAVATMAIGWLLFVVLWRHTHPHYYFGAWILFVWFAWTALDALPRRIGGAAGAGLALSLAVVLGFQIADVHRHGGNRQLHFGSTLATQVEVARRLGRAHPEAPLRVEVPAALMFPHTLPILRRLIDAGGDPAGSRRPLRLRYRDPAATDGWLVVDEAP